MVSENVPETSRIDARVSAAAAHWAPRFVAAGVDFNDFQRTIARIERWEDWLQEWCRTGEIHETLARDAERAGRTRTAGEAYVRAALAYHFARFVWLLGPERRQAGERAVASLYAAHAHLDPSAERVEVPFDGGRLVGNLRRPPGAERPPLVLLIAGLDSTKEEYFGWEDVLLARGLATFSLDGPGQGESAHDFLIRPEYETPVAATLDALAGRRDLDLDRVGAIGLSLGGYYAPRAAAVEERVRCVVGVSGPFNFGECWDGLPQLTRDTFVHHAGAADAEDGRRKALELDLAPVADGLRQPCLIVTGRDDRVIPWQQSERIARAARRGTFVLFENANHVCNDVPYLYRPLAADWMEEKLRHVG